MHFKSFDNLHTWWSGTKTLKSTTANTDVNLSPGGDAPHLAINGKNYHDILVNMILFGLLSAFQRDISHVNVYANSKFINRLKKIVIVSPISDSVPCTFIQII